MRVRVPVLDGFRGLATAAVVLYHCFLGAGLPTLQEGAIRALLAVGYIGVDFFFVISGFVLFLPTAVRGGDFGSRREYARRRIARIVPAYLLFLGLVIALHPLLIPGPGPRPFESVRSLLALLSHMTFLQHSLGWIVGPPGYDLLTVAWTLAVEVSFYVLLPLVAVRYHRHPLVGFGIALVLSLVWRALVTDVPGSLGWLGAGDWSPGRVATVEVALLTQLPNYLAHFAAGMTAAWAFVRLGAGSGAVAIRRWAPAVQVTAGAVLLWWMVAEGTRSLRPLGSSHGLYDPWTRTTPLAILFAVLVLATALGPRWARWPFENPLARGLGAVSYGVYLSHLALVGFALTTLAYFPSATVGAYLKMVAFVVPVTLTIGTLSWLVVERPARLWARNRSVRGTVVAPDAPITGTPAG